MVDMAALITLGVILLCLTCKASAQNADFYHTLSMKALPGPVNNSYFGYSVTYDRDNKVLIVGAPTDDVSGAVYECDVSSYKCTRLDHPEIRPVPNYKKDYWFGATVKSGSNFVVACTPRAIRTFATRLHSGNRSQPIDNVGMFGHCYKRDMKRNFTRTLQTFHDKPIPLNGIGPEKSMNTLGWDMDIGADNSIVIGGPALYRDTGLAAIMPAGIKNQRFQNIEEIKASYNFGYSVAAGYFFNRNLISYAVGSTYGKNGPGQVYFYHKIKADISYLSTLNKEEDLDKVGSMFGGVLCAAKLVRRSYNVHDLIVGAPTYSDASGYNTGAVYVYVSRIRNSALVYSRKIIGEMYGSFFGSAIVSLEDLNGDDADEVAIGAPYENEGRGAVYLYSGADLFRNGNEKALKWMQRLQPEGFRSFGLSLAVLKDYDNNGCNELAVSAPYDDKVALYKCMAAVRITRLSAIFPNLQNRTHLNITDFTFNVCVHVEYPVIPQTIIATISTDIKISHVSARLKSKNGVFSFEQSLNQKRSILCKPAEIILPLDGDYGMEIGYTITTKLLNSPIFIPEFESSRVILSDLSMLSYTGAVWAAECAGKECISNLSLAITPMQASYPYIIGSSTKGSVSIDVYNTGEVAYDPCIQIAISAVRLYKPPMECTAMPDLENTWLCISRKPVKTNTHWYINNITLDLTKLTNRDKDITLSVLLFERCDRNESKDFSHVIALKSLENFHIRGHSNFGDVIGMSKNDLRLYGKQLQHIYTIVNNGPTNFVDLMAEVQLHNQSFIKYSSQPVNIFTEITTQKRQECNIVPSENSIIIARCPIESFRTKNHVQIIISMDIVPSEQLYEKVEKQNETVNSVISLLMDKKRIATKRISSTVQLQTATVDLWIYIVAGIVGLCLIVILALILRECGFLRRKNKEDLKRLKRSVHRQSMRRSMMQQLRKEDRESILEGIEEVVQDPACHVPTSSAT